MNADYPSRPAEYYVAVTPSDDDELPTVHGRHSRALYIGTGGVIVVEDGAGNITPHKVADSQVLPICAFKVHDTDTTAADIVAWY